MSKKIVISETGVMLIRNIGIFIAAFHLFVMVIFLSGKYQIHAAFVFIMGITVIGTASMLMQSVKVDIVEKNDEGLIGSLTLILLYYLIEEIDIQQTALVIYIGYVVVTLYQMYGKKQLGKNDKKNQSEQPKLTNERLNKILSDYGKYIEENPEPCTIRDVSVLPHTKEEILMALQMGIVYANDKDIVNIYKSSAIFLSGFQENLGAIPLTALGVDMNDRSKYSEEEFIKKIADYPDHEKYEKFRKIADEDYKMNILPKIKLAEDIRNKKEVNNYAIS